MFPVGKYKLIGILAGSAVASYGAYEIYKQFGPSYVSAAHYDDQKQVEAIEDEGLSGDLLSNDEAPEDVVDNAVDEVQVPPRLEEKLEPKGEFVSKIPEKSDSKSQSKKAQVDGYANYISN